MRTLLFSAALALLPGLCLAQTAMPDKSELAAIRTELATLFGEIQSLRALQGAEPAPAIRSGLDDTPLVVRLDRLEEEMRALTGRVEELDYRISAIAEDGTRRIGDLEFRLVELEGGDVASIGPTSLLGGEPAAAPAPTAVQPAAPTVQLAYSEQSDFDAALNALKDGEVEMALTGFTKFLQDYPGGPLAAEAMFHMGEAQTQQGAHKRAAQAYLDAFTAAPDGPYAAHALMKVGLALGQLGKPQEACATLEEVLARYPGSAIEPELMSNRQSLGCT